MTESLQGRALGPNWRVTSHTKDELVLEQSTNEWRRAGGSLVVSVGCLAVGLSLALVTPESARLIIWPVSGLLFLVALLGLPASLRNLQRARRGVRLSFTREGVEGWPVKMTFAPRRAVLAEVDRVSVQVFEHPPLSLAILEVLLKDGTRLAGPEVAVPSGEKHPLGPLSAAINALISAGSGGSPN